MEGANMNDVKRDSYGRLCRVVKGDFAPIPRDTLVRAAMTKVENAFPHRKTTITHLPESKLMFAIVNGHAHDLVDPKYREGALLYFKGDIYHAELCGVNSDWIREVLTAVDAFKPIGGE
jgi:hypothetical protein